MHAHLLLCKRIFAFGDIVEFQEIDVACTDMHDDLFFVVPLGNQVPSAISGPDS